MHIKSFIFGGILATAISISSIAQAFEFVQNGSFELGSFVPVTQNYMQLPNGSTTISNWTVATSSNNIAWALSPTGDGHSAADGSYFVDLSGFGHESSDGSLRQLLLTTPGQTYAFSIDYEYSIPGATIGSQAISLSATGSAGGWTIATGTFTAPAGSQLLAINNITPGSDLVFIDNVSVTGNLTGGVPEPSTWAMMVLGFAAVGLVTHRRRNKLTQAPA